MNITPNPNPDAPLAYSIYIPDQQSGYVVEDIEDAMDDLTNYDCEITPLFAAAVPMTEDQRTALVEKWNWDEIKTAHDLVRAVEAFHNIGVKL